MGESGQLKIDRKNFSTFLLNLEPASFTAMLCPYIPLGQVAQKAWGGSKALYTAAYAAAWLAMIVFACLGAVDAAFGYMAGAMYFLMAFVAAGLRVATRTKLGISGDMAAEDFSCARDGKALDFGSQDGNKEADARA